MNWEAPELTKDRRGAQKYGIDLEKNRYPYALVWSPLPLISWIIPFIGHMGICDSRGVIYDFAGPYMIGVDDMAFGRPTKYLLLNPSKIGRKDKPAQEVWDSCVDHGCSVYSRRMHNIWYDGKTNWNMVILCFWVYFCGKWISVGRALQSLLPFLCIFGFFLAVGLSFRK